MKTPRAPVPCLLLVLVLVFAAAASGDVAPVQQTVPPANPAIDMEGYLKVARQAALYRETRRLTEEDFLRASREPGTVILDARSRERFDQLHVKGALNLSFPDIAVESVKKALPDKSVRILIYCNNNFRGAEGPFPSKLPTASLNLSTFIALYNYGYRNVWELGPLVDVRTTKIPLEPTRK
jgi:hypothetical protein